MPPRTPTPFAFDFVTREPGGRLGRFVQSVWHARGTVPYAREKIAPTGSTVAVFVLGDPIVQTPNDGKGEPFRAERGFLVGPHHRPSVNAPCGETFAVGIVCTPVGCEAVFDVRPSSLRGRVVDLETHWPAARALRGALLGASSADERLTLLIRHLETRAEVSIPGLERCATAVAMLEADPARPIADIAAELGVSHGYLDRQLARVVGSTPRALASLLRVRRLLQGLDVQQDPDWADLAAEHGWFDQGHLIRDFKRYTGVTPAHYIRAQRAFYSPVQGDDAAGFVPDI